MAVKINVEAGQIFVVADSYIRNQAKHSNISMENYKLGKVQDSLLMNRVSTEKEAPAPTYWRESVQPCWALGWV